MGTLPVMAELMVGSTWTDITADMYRRDLINITRGISSSGTTADPAQCGLTLKNKDGRYSPRNPLSPYYGLIGRNTQLRVSVLAGTPWLGLTDSTVAAVTATTPDASALDITGDLDVRFDIAPASWSDPSYLKLGGKYVHAGNQLSWVLVLIGGQLQFIWSPDGSTSNTNNFSTAVIPNAPFERMTVRATFDVNNGASGSTITFYTGPSLSGPWTQLGAPVVNTGTTSIFSSTSPVKIGEYDSLLPESRAASRMYGAQIRNGINGTVVASPDFTAQAPGTLTWTDSAGRPWTASSTTALTNKNVRAVVEVSEWPPAWDPSGGDVWVPVTGSGITKRLASGQTPLHSPIRRDITSPARTGIVAYWPMEDGTDATSIASGLPAGAAMRVNGTITPAADSSWAASEPLPTLGTGQLSGTVQPYTSTGTIYTRMYLATPTGGIGSTQKIVSISTGGTAAVWTLFGDSAGDLALIAYDNTGATLYSSTPVAFGINGRPMLIDFTLVQDGANVDWAIAGTYLDTSTINNQVVLGFNGTLTGATIGRATAARVGEGGGLGDSVVGHLVIADTLAAFNNTINAALGWAGESAIARVSRLGIEENLSIHAAGDPAASALLGPQAVDTILNLLQAAADADGALLYEQREGVGLVFRGRDTLYNQVPRLVLDYTKPGLAPPLSPTDDTTYVVNDATISRDQGGSARATLDTGALSTLPPPLGVGRYAVSTSLGLFADSQTPDVAAWTVHVGTWDEARYPGVSVNLRRLDDVDTVLAATLDTGDGVQIINLPPWLPPGAVNQLVQGYTEAIGYTWDITFNGTPAGPYSVAVLEDLVVGHLDTDGSSLHAGITATATSMQVDAVAGPLWTTASGDFPFDVSLGGEVVTVTNITGSSSPQTFTITRAVNGISKAQTALTDIRLTHPMILSL